MSIKVTVTRAPRLKLVPSYEIPIFHFDLAADGRVTYQFQAGEFAVIDTGKDGASHWPDTTLFHDLGDSEAFAKWVVGGRKLEDLQGDGKDEWALFEDLPAFTLFTNGRDDRVFSKLGHPYSKSDVEYAALRIGSSDNHGFAGIKVWPLGAGDTITITGE